MIKRFIILTGFFTIVVGITFAQTGNNQEEKILGNHIFSKNIHTAEIYQQGWRMSYPYLRLGSDSRLCLDFDDLGETYKDYYYTFIHCDAQWHPSDIPVEDYLNGFTENQITNYKHSINTTVPYIHYHLSFPNDDVRFRVTGNYIILVYKDLNKENPVLTARFMVYSNRVTIRGKVIPPIGPDRARDQQLHFSVRFPGYPLRSPQDELFVVIRQNNRWDNARFGVTASQQRNSELIYENASGITFHGNNEFRDFDIKSIRYQSPNIAKIEYVPPYYNIRLKPSAFHTFDPYFSKKDLNGKYYIENSLGSNPDTDADYLNVFFNLPANFPLDGGDVYVFGALTGWDFGKENRMTYNMDTHQYEETMLLKQGYYNYAYAVKSPKQEQGDLTRIEGSHFETGNDYTILVYYRSSFERYDRLIGVKIINNGTDK